MSEPNVFWDCITYVHGLAKSALEGEDVFVSIGGSTVQRASEFIVREIVESVSFSDRSTSGMGANGARGCYRVEFNVACEAWTKKKGLLTSSELVQRWMLALFRKVAADKTLGGNCIHAEPYVENGGTAIDTNKLYVSAFNFGIHIKAEIDPAKES